MAQKNFWAMAQTLIFWGFEPWLKPTFDMQILTSVFSLFHILSPNDPIQQFTLKETDNVN